MAWLGAALGLALIAIVFVDAFEVMLLPRRVRHAYRLARLYYRWAWQVWRGIARGLPGGAFRHAFLGVFGPLSLFALIFLWALGLIAGFALLHWSLDTGISGTDGNFFAYLYFSGGTFFTLGFGDMVPSGALGRFLSIAEAAIGFIFLAVIISYLPVLYQAFSRREITISLLDARAGSPPTAGEFLRRLAEARQPTCGFLGEWERWAAELLESHLSFPLLSYYRSQHDNQSWVAALTMILDTTALMIAAAKDSDGYPARLTFAMARHAAVDLGMVYSQLPRAPKQDRLPPPEWERLHASLSGAGLPLRDGPESAKALAELRALYEPFVNTLAIFFQLTLPPFLPTQTPVDNWQTAPSTRRSPGLGGLAGSDEVH